MPSRPGSQTPSNRAMAATRRRKVRHAPESTSGISSRRLELEVVRLEGFKIRSLPGQLAARPGVIKILGYRHGASRASRSKENAMLQSGRVAFGAMETVVFGKPAAETVAEEARRRDAERVFLMVSGTLNRTTDEVAKVRRALGNRFAGLFDHMLPHTPRHAVIEAAEMTREA